jgi:uncharacterized membrane protein YcaP (DUF421 family)
MYSTDAELWDWMRILMGGTPLIFLVEVILRITVLYLLLIMTMRFMGKRMYALISRVEMIALVSLAAAIGIPIQDPASGLLSAFIIAAVAIGVQYTVSINAMKHPEFEALILDNIIVLVEEGRMELKNMQKSKISRERLLAELRGREITNLGKVQEVFLEANGAFSIFLFEQEREGLCILPEWDTDFIRELKEIPDTYACGSCGNLIKNVKETEDECRHCGQKQWQQAVRS